jgi:hypothetical protein
MQMKIGRWAGLYPRIQSTAKHIRCGFVCGLRKIASPFGRNGARSLVPLNRVYTVLTQARTGPPKRSESNESMEHIGTPVLPAVVARTVSTYSGIKGPQ